MYKFFLIFILIVCSVNNANASSSAALPDFTPEELLQLKDKANDGDKEAAYKLSLYFNYILIDPKEGSYWEEKAAEMGNYDAAYGMGVRYIYEPEVRDIEKARYWFKKATEAGAYHANEYLKSFLSNSDVEKLENLAIQGDADAAKKLSDFYSYIENDYSEAHFWLNLWAKNKFHRDMGDVNSGGQSYELSREQIKELSSKAEHGDGEAANQLAHYYSRVAHYDSKGFYWMVRAAENGSAGAMYNLGFEYLNFSEIKNKNRAIFWFKKAAAQGDALAKKYVEKFLSDDDIEIFTNKANAGDADSAFRLYEYYRFVEPNFKEEKFWVKVAAKNGHPGAKELIKTRQYSK